MAPTPNTVISQLSKKQISIQEAIRIDSVRSSILDLIKLENPSFDINGFISINELNKLIEIHIKNLLELDKGELTKLDNEVLESMVKNDLLSKNVDNEDATTTFGEQLADKIAEFGGSWRFIIFFGGFIFIWILINAVFLISNAYDPYPFILLNLILSCLAALQAPVIMMSQNRMEAKDRERSLNDYKINLKAELEIRHLHEKVDHLIMKQMAHLNEIQQIQIDLLKEISQNKK